MLLRRITTYFLFLLFLFVDTTLSLNDHPQTNPLATTIFLACFVTVIVLIIIFHCWIKHRPLHDVDWDKQCVDDLQRLSEQLQNMEVGVEGEVVDKSLKSQVLKEHEHWMKYLS